MRCLVASALVLVVGSAAGAEPPHIDVRSVKPRELPLAYAGP
jgi:hypothetical protein